mmetsp:Transcript_20771/g.36977  ORF Transcript_20771/g.36977 Transcript_20771/m.36977 type:complete len:247 (+) Transcript_20771:479-1219(+)
MNELFLRRSWPAKRRHRNAVLLRDAADDRFDALLLLHHLLVAQQPGILLPRFELDESSVPMVGFVALGLPKQLEQAFHHGCSGLGSNELDRHICDSEAPQNQLKDRRRLNAMARTSPPHHHSQTLELGMEFSIPDSPALVQRHEDQVFQQVDVGFVLDVFRGGCLAVSIARVALPVACHHQRRVRLFATARNNLVVHSGLDLDLDGQQLLKLLGQPSSSGFCGLLFYYLAFVGDIEFFALLNISNV